MNGITKLILIGKVVGIPDFRHMRNNSTSSTEMCVFTIDVDTSVEDIYEVTTFKKACLETLRAVRPGDILYVECKIKRKFDKWYVNAHTIEILS
jgi:single-stranded DNA-binding protein